MPVSSHTVLPSVTGDGDVMSPLRTLWLPAPIDCFQRTVPVPRSTAHSASGAPSLALSATLRKTRPPATIGVEPESVGSGSFQATFSVADQDSGSPRSALTPFCDGPRHIGQSSAEAVPPAAADRTAASTTWRLVMARVSRCHRSYARCATGAYPAGSSLRRPAQRLRLGTFAMSITHACSSSWKPSTSGSAASSSVPWGSA